MSELLNRKLLYVTAAKFFPALAGLGFIVVSVRYYQFTDYAFFSLAFAMANLISVISVVWICQAVQRFAGYTNSGLANMRTIVGVGTGSAISFSVLAQMIDSGDLTQFPGVRWEVPVLGISLSLNAMSSAYAIALQKFQPYQVAEITRGALLFILVVLGVFLQPNSNGLVLAYAFATLVPSVLLLRYLFKKKVLSSGEPLASMLRQYFHYGWPMTIWAGLQCIQALIERNVLSEVLPMEEFGSFMASTDAVMRGIGLALMPVVTLIHAKLMATEGHGSEIGVSGRRLLESGFRLVILGGMALTGLVFIARNQIAYVLPSFARLDFTTLILLCTAAVLWVIALLIHKPLELARKTKRMSAVLAIVVAIQWVLLSHWSDIWRETSMPMASCVAAVLYIGICTLAIRAR